MAGKWRKYIFLEILISLCLGIGCRRGQYSRSGTDNEEFDSYHNMTDLEEYPDVCSDFGSEECASSWLRETNKIYSRNENRLSNVQYTYSTNITKRNEELMTKFEVRSIGIGRKYEEKFQKFQWRKFKSPEIKRIFKLKSQTIESKNSTVSKLLAHINEKIKSIYNNGKPCYTECLAEGESEIMDLFRSERNYERLQGFWSAWRNVTGRKIKNLFLKRMDLENMGARENGYSDAASFELKHSFEEDDFKDTVIRLYEDVLPLYRQLHGYVRYCLVKFYPGRFDANGPIPAHILGNLFAQQWQNIMPILQQCQEKGPSDNIHNEANKNLQQMSVKDMFKMAEEFYTSIGMDAMTDNFWNRSVIKQEPERVIDCHGSAFDFSNRMDYRILMCTQQNINDFTTIHHEMGHIEYYMAYRNLTVQFKRSPNPGFHEAIGDTIALSVKTPEHLKRVGLISTVPTSVEFDINYLLLTALEKVAFLPFALTMDSFIWDVYNGSVPLDKLNQHWWNLRYRYQGLKAPIERTEEDFDAASKYHVAFGISYIRYFTSFFLQFQFYESMCKLSGHKGPLHRCDFYQSKEAGAQMLKMLQKGSSQHWKDTLPILTGSKRISSASILSFFNPLYNWLKETNERLKVSIGW